MASADEDAPEMGIKVQVRTDPELRKALLQLTNLLFQHDASPTGRRTKWYKKRHDYYLKPSVRRRRRKHTVDRKKRGIFRPCSFDWLDGDWVEREEL